MRYIGRQGESLSRDEWCQRFRDPRYSIVQKTDRRVQMVVTSWIGLRLEGEPEARLFLVQVLQRFKRRQGNTQIWEEGREEKRATWCQTEAAALVEHRRLEQEIA